MDHKDAMRTILEEAARLDLEDDPELCAKKRREFLDDLKQVRAVLVSIHVDRAEWRTEDGKSVHGRPYTSMSFGVTDEYGVMEEFPGTFRKWLQASRSVLLAGKKDPHHVSMTGMLSVSHMFKLIAGWHEDYTDDDSLLLCISETMEE